MNDENLVSEFLLISFYFILRIVQHNIFSSDIVAKQNSCILLLITDQQT